MSFLHQIKIQLDGVANRKGVLQKELAELEEYEKSLQHILDYHINENNQTTKERESEELRHCTRCGNEKPLESFPIRKDKDPPLRRRVCKECFNEEQKKAYNAGRELLRSKNAKIPKIPKIPKTSKTEKDCRKCHRILPHSAFGKDKSQKDGLARICRECSRAYQKEWRDKLNEAEGKGSRKESRKGKTEGTVPADEEKSSGA